MSDMGRAGRFFAAWCGAVCACAGLGGCVTNESVLADLHSARVARYEIWKGEKGSRPQERQQLSGALSLQDCITIALANSSQLKIAEQERERARALLLQAYGEAMPKVDFVGTYTRLDQASSISVGPISATLGRKDNYSGITNVTQPLYRGGQIEAGIRAASIFDVLTAEKYRSARQNLIVNVRKAYYDAKLDEALAAAATDAVTVAQRLLDDVRKNLEAGVASNFDVLRADVELKNLVALQVQAQNATKLAVTALLNVLSVSQESEITLRDDFIYNALSPEKDEAVRTAFMRQSALIQGELNVRLQQEALNAAKSGFLPKLDFFYSFLYAKPDPHNSMVNDFGSHWDTGLSLTYTLFEGFKTASAVRQARISLNESRYQLRITEDRVLLAVEQALLNIVSARRLVESQEANVAQATEAMRLVELGYREGVRKQVELLDARRALTQAQATRALALYSHETARLEYEAATGVIGETAETAVEK